MAAESAGRVHVDYSAAAVTDPEAEFHAALRASATTEAKCDAEDEDATELVGQVLLSMHRCDPTFESTFDPKRDGDCATNCAVENDKDLPPADVLRRVVTAHVLRKKLAVALGKNDDAAAAAAFAASDVMARPGVVMGEDELQALADVRQAPVEVRSAICARASSDFGSVLPPKVYLPLPLLSGKERVGSGKRLVLLQEVRAHRMSHFQLLRFKSSAPSEPSTNEVLHSDKASEDYGAEGIFAQVGGGGSGMDSGDSDLDGSDNEVSSQPQPIRRSIFGAAAAAATPARISSAEATATVPKRKQNDAVPAKKAQTTAPKRNKKGAVPGGQVRIDAAFATTAPAKRPERRKIVEVYEEGSKASASFTSPGGSDYSTLCHMKRGASDAGLDIVRRVNADGTRTLIPTTPAGVESRPDGQAAKDAKSLRKQLPADISNETLQAKLDKSQAPKAPRDRSDRNQSGRRSIEDKAVRKEATQKRKDDLEKATLAADEKRRRKRYQQNSELLAKMSAQRGREWLERSKTPLSDDHFSGVSTS